MLSGGHILAIVLAFGASIAVATHNLFVRSGTEHGTPADAYFVVVSISTVVLVPIVGVIYYPNYGLTLVAGLSFISAGLVGALFGMLMLYVSIERIGAGRTTPIMASQALFATILGVLILGETLNAAHAAGVLLMVIGIAVIARETSTENPDNLSRRDLLFSLSFAFGAAIAFGWEPIFANFGFAEGTPAMVGAAVKTTAAWLGFTLYLRYRRGLAHLSRIRSDDLRWYMLAGIAYTLFMIGYYFGLEIAPVSLVVPIIITSTLWVVVLSALVMPQRLERVTWRLGAAATLVVIGAILVTTFA